MTSIRTLLFAAAALALGAVPVGIGPVSLGDTAFAQGPDWLGLGRRGPPVDLPGIGGDRFGRGGPPFGLPGRGGDRFERHEDRVERGLERFGRAGDTFDGDRFDRDRFDRDRFDRDRFGGELGRFGRAEGRFDGGRFGHGGGFCPPGLADKDCFPPGAQQFRQGFCPPGLADKGCMPPGLRVFGRGDVIPRRTRLDRIFHHDFGLAPPGPGNFYARIDNDVYLVTEATYRVIDAFSLLGAIGR